MDKKLTLIPTRWMTLEEWLAYRLTGIGASEIGTLLGLDDYKSSLELYYEKIGDINKPRIENMAMFIGKEQEDFIAKLWRYWDGSEESVVNNWRAGTPVRKCHRVLAYVRNPDFPWLFVSLDRVINKTVSRGEGSLELKTIGGFELNKWEFDIPPKYVAQVNTQMLVPRFEFGELALFEDGRHLQVFPFEPSVNICNQILTVSEDFWKRVTKAKEFVAHKYIGIAEYNQRLVDDCNAEIDKLAPEPDGSLAYAEFMKEKYLTPKFNERDGSEEELNWARSALSTKAEIDGLIRDARLYENRLKDAMKDHEILDFGPAGRVYWMESKSGGRRFSNKIKPGDDPILVR